MAKGLMICNLGVSTKMLKDKIQEALAASGDDFELLAEPRSSLEDLIGQVDIVLIAPQIAYLKDEIVELCSRNSKKCMLIPPQLYGLMDGKAVAEAILKALAT